MWGSGAVVRVALVAEHQLFGELVAHAMREFGIDTEVVDVRSMEVGGHRKGKADVVVVEADCESLRGAAGHVPRALTLAGSSPVLFITDGEAAGALLDAFHRGASGWLSFTASLEDVRRAIVALRSGGSVASPQQIRDLLGPSRAKSEAIASMPRPVFTNRERQVFEHLCAGASTMEIAGSLGVAVSTVRSYVRGIVRKLGVRSKFQAATTIGNGGSHCGYGERRRRDSCGDLRGPTAAAGGAR